MDPSVLVSGHETIFEGSQIEGTGRRRCRNAQGGRRKDFLSVSMPTIKRWLKRRRETGDVQPRAIPGRPPRKGAMLKEWLPEHLEANHDLTLEEHRQAFEEEFGEEVSTSTIGRAIAGLPNGGWPLKKSHP
jgi:transposase